MKKLGLIASLIFTVCLNAHAQEGSASEVGGSASTPVNQNIRPIMRIEPRYPSDAKDEGIEGHVVLNFDINTKGKPENIKVVNSVPEGVFDKNAIAALSRWKYKPEIVNGMVVAQPNIEVVLEFKLTN